MVRLIGMVLVVVLAGCGSGKKKAVEKEKAAGEVLRRSVPGPF